MCTSDAYSSANVYNRSCCRHGELYVSVSARAQKSPGRDAVRQLCDLNLVCLCGLIVRLINEINTFAILEMHVELFMVMFMSCTCTVNVECKARVYQTIFEQNAGRERATKGSRTNKCVHFMRNYLFIYAVSMDASGCRA